MNNKGNNNNEIADASTVLPFPTMTYITYNNSKNKRSVWLKLHFGTYRGTLDDSIMLLNVLLLKQDLDCTNVKDYTYSM